MAHRQINRRFILKSVPLAAGALAAGPVFAHTPSPNDGPKNMRVSLAAYSVRQDLTGGQMDLFGFIDWCADMGLSGTELTSYYFKENFDDAYLHDLRLHAFKRGVTVSGTAVRNDFCMPPGPEREKEVAGVKRWVDVAAELFAPHIRIFAGNVPRGADKSAALIWVADAIKEVLDYAAKRGIVIGLENHGGITARAADHLAICDAVGESPWFGINLDTGNYRTNAYEELAMAAPRSVNVQIKAEIHLNDGTDVPVDLEKIRDILMAADYKGWVALEYEAENPKTEIPKYIERMKALFEI